MTMKKTDLEKFKAKQLGNRLSREQAARHGRQTASRGPDGSDIRPVEGLVGKLLRKALGEEDAAD
jgi:hypothetical protein